MNLKQRIANWLTYDQKTRLRLVFARHRRPRIDASPFVLPSRVLVGTHHRAGTHWLESVFRTICGRHFLRYYAGPHAALPEEWDVFLEHHSRFDFTRLPAVFRGIHIIRDPRDIVVSGCLYHQTSDEPWLHASDSKFDGRSYQQAINRFASLDDKILFEMENIARITIDDMSRWQYTNPCFMELRYEELIVDTDLMLFHQIFSFLEFPGRVLPSTLEIAQQNSVFADKATASRHIRSEQARKWKKHFKRRHRQRLLELFGDVLVRLRYEPDDMWANADASQDAHGQKPDNEAYPIGRASA
jgi:hypothetical protein